MGILTVVYIFFYPLRPTFYYLFRLRISSILSSHKAPEYREVLYYAPTFPSKVIKHNVSFSSTPTCSVPRHLNTLARRSLGIGNHVMRFRSLFAFYIFSTLKLMSSFFFYLRWYLFAQSLHKRCKLLIMSSKILANPPKMVLWSIFSNIIRCFMLPELRKWSIDILIFWFASSLILIHGSACYIAANWHQ